MFFTRHNKLTIVDTPTNSLKSITDITSYINFASNLKNTKVCVPYNIVEGDTPESLSNSFYDLQSYSWIILLVNQITNINTDWPKSSTSFDNYLNQKYGDNISLFLKLDSIKDYDIKKGNSICVLGSPEKTIADVVSWDASLSKLVLSPTVSLQKFQKNNKIAYVSDPSTEIATIGRVVNYDVQSLHHFELENQYIDPLLGLLQAYINGTNENVITNYDYEMSQNDLKRSIFLPKKEYIQSIMREYSNLYKQ